MRLATEVQVRPTRIALLVSPDDAASISRFQQLCACLWGGALNPIIPVSAEVPAAWRKAHDTVSGDDLARRYLAFFEPDVLVEAEPGMAERLGYGLGRGDDEHVIALDEFFSLEHDGAVRAGLIVTDAFMDRHDREGRFVQREPEIRALPEEGGEPHYAELVWGVFPQDPGLAFVRAVYEKAFSPVEATATVETWREYQRQGAGGPFQAGIDGLEMVLRDEATLRYFLFDPANPLDRIDFWNLRLFRAPVRGVPVTWLADAGPDIRRAIVEAASVPGREHEGAAPVAVVEFSETLSPEVVQSAIEEHFSDLPAGAVIVQTFYDRPRQAGREGRERPQRLGVYARKRVDETLVDERRRVSFTALAPPFKVSYGFNPYRWVNVLTFPFVDLSADVALVYPLSGGQRGFPAINQRHWSRISATREGLILPQWRDEDYGELELQSKEQAVQDWVRRQGLKAVPSGAGRIARELLRALGGAWGAHLVSEPEILKLLDRMAASQTEHVGRGDRRIVRRFEGKTALVSEWTGLLSRLSKTKDYSHEVSAFVERNILKLGLSARCAFCTQDNWYPLDRFGYELPCERCLRSFPIPEEVTRPQAWRYRVIGSFAVSNYADGAYGVALTLRFFELLLSRRAEMTASTALEFSIGSKKVETDFLFWWRPKASDGLDDAPRTVFGEAKSFAVNAIDARTVEGLHALADLFPGGVAVVAKLGDAYSPTEKALLRTFIAQRAEAGCDNPLVVLTGRELLARQSLSATWTKTGGRHAASVSHELGRDLHRFAALTQALYL